jgi:hypothetical protein
MSLEFVIIPFNATFEKNALTIKSQIEDNLSSINLSMDTDYSKSYNSRQNKWKQTDYNIIMVNQDFESNYIHVTIDAKQERMTVEEFVDLVSNFDHNDDDASDNSVEDNCIIC